MVIEKDTWKNRIRLEDSEEEILRKRHLQFLAKEERYPKYLKYQQDRHKTSKISRQSLLGDKCIYCGETDSDLLQFDLVTGVHNGSRKGLYQDILDNSEKYQLLCANCNQLKKFRLNQVGGNPKPISSLDLDSIEIPSYVPKDKKDIYIKFLKKEDGYRYRRDRDKQQLWREEIIDLLGRVCIRCEYDNIEILQIDHIIGGRGKTKGKDIRKMLGSNNKQYYEYLKSNLDTVQLLCPNCHTKKSVIEDYLDTSIKGTL